MVETALLLPVMLLVLTGILAFGVALNNYLVLTNAVNVGDQQLSISRGISADPCKTAATAITNSAFYLTPANISLTFTINGSSFSGTGATATCTAGAADMVQGTPAEIQASYPCTLTIAGMSLAGGLKCLQTQTTEIIQ
jgi:Flp pilus assembly protein TadG